MPPRPPTSTLFPYTTLFRSMGVTTGDFNNDGFVDIYRTGLGGRCRQNRRRSEEHTSELQSLTKIVCRLLLEKKKIHYGPAASSSSHCQRSTRPSYHPLLRRF